MIVNSLLESRFLDVLNYFKDYLWYRTKWELGSPISSNHPLSESRQLSIISLAAIIHYPRWPICLETQQGVMLSQIGGTRHWGKSDLWLVVNFLWNFTLLSPVLILHGMNFKILRIRLPLIYREVEGKRKSCGRFNILGRDCFVSNAAQPMWLRLWWQYN